MDVSLLYVAKVFDFNLRVTVRVGKPKLDQVVRENEKQLPQRRVDGFHRALVLEVPVPDKVVMTIGEQTTPK
jgi:hypothetical protein